MFLWAFLIGLASANPTCSVVPTWKWNVHFECSQQDSLTNTIQRHTANVLPSDTDDEKKAKLEQLQRSCGSADVKVFLSRSGPGSGRKRRNLEYWLDKSTWPNSGNWNDLDDDECPGCFTEENNDFVFGKIHVMLVIDLDVMSNIFWTNHMPLSLKHHLEEVFPADSRKRRSIDDWFGNMVSPDSGDWNSGPWVTYELILGGPNNIYMHYPFEKPEGDRKRRSIDDWFGNMISPDSGNWNGDPTEWEFEHHGSVCHIEHRDGLINRLLLATRTVPSLPQSIYKYAGLTKAKGARNLIAGLARFLPNSGNVLVINVANNLNDVTPEDSVEFHKFMNHFQSQRPDLRIAFNWHFGPEAFGVEGRKRRSIDDWFGNLVNPNSGNWNEAWPTGSFNGNWGEGAMAAETGNSANFLAHGPGGITGAHLIAGWADKGFEIEQFDANWDWAAANQAVWKYNGYYKTPQGKFAHVGTLTDTQTTMCAVHWLVFGNRKHAACGFDVGVITDPPVTISPPIGGSGCAAQPCQNGCTCQASCRDENDYVCVPPPGASLIGKNCEYEATVMCHADRSISISVPRQAINDYAMGVSNVVLQGCNPPRGSKANQFLCDTNQPSCGPPVAPRANSPSVSLTCPASSNLMVGAGSAFTFRQTFVFERASAVISMPRPLVTVECKMATVPASAVITPQIRDPNSKRMVLTWVPRITFFKTQFGNPQVKLVGDGNAFPDGSFGYIIGEKIHVRINAALNGRLGSSLPNSHNIKLDSCVIQRGSNQGTQIPIIQNGNVVSGLPFPVAIDQGSGSMGANVPLSQEGVAFNFQVFTFGPGQTLQLTCSVDIDAARKRRSAANETVLVEKVRASILFFEPEDTVETDVARMSLIQEPARMDISNLLKSSKSEEDLNAVEIEEILENDSKWLGQSPWLILAMIAGAALVVLVLATTVIRQRFQSVVEYEPSMKPLVEKY